MSDMRALTTLLPGRDSRPASAAPGRLFVLGALAWLCAVWCLPLPASAQPVNRQQLHGHLPPAVAHLTALRRLPPTNRLDLAIGLPLRNREALANLVEQLYDPASPNYRQYLTPARFAERFGPTEQDYRQVVAFVESHRLRLSSQQRDRAVLDVNGSVADIERAFHLNLKVYRHPKENRTFFAPDAEPALDLSVPLESISGLDDFVLPRPLGLHATAFDATAYSTPVATGSGPRGTFWGADFRAAYAPGVALDGTGETVGLVAFDGYYPSDVRAYANLAGLPNVPVTNVLLNNFSGQPGANNLEVALDIDMSVAMAPALSRVIVYEGRLLNSILNRMATDTNSLGQPLSRQLSSSWGFGTTRDNTRDNLFLRLQAQGQSFFQASSDDGARCVACPPFPPTDNPYITVVGGSSLTTTQPGGAWSAETVWLFGGSGVSTSYPIPSWQRDLNMTCSAGSTTNRNFPDVAALGDAVIWVLADNGRQYRIGGTSASAPLWAGFAALVNQQAALSGKPPVGFLNPAIYAIGSGPDYHLAFHDVTEGNNTNTCCEALRYFACPGYDLCTGWGTPNGAGLIAALLAPPDALRITPAEDFMATGPVQGPFSPPVQTYSLTNAGSVSLNWTQVNTPAWLAVSPSGGTLVPGGPAVTVTLSPNAAAANLAAGGYAATLWFTNLNNYFSQSRRFTLNVVTPPLITSQPADLALLEGMTAVFTVGTAPNALLFYQWSFNGTNLSGAAGPTLTLVNVTLADAGTYSVIVSNAAGQAASSDARLTVQASSPVVTAQPADRAALPGQTVTLSLSAAGSPPLLYLWSRNSTFLRDGGNLSGTATSALTIRNVSAADAGTYAAIVVNGLGFTLSSNALLTVASVTAPGVTLASLRSFGGTNGSHPNGLVQGTDGHLYGTTQAGGSNAFGTLFRLTTGGALTNLWSFTGSDGANPRAALARGAGSDLYGTTYSGGASALGSIFKTDTTGAVLSLFSFDTPDGVLPSSGLTPAADGNFYGTAPVGGTNAPLGMVYRITPDGAVSNLYSFGGGSDGSLPYAGLALGPDGAVYGTTYAGGAAANGTAFRITTDGAFNSLASFTGADGAFPQAELALGSDGNLYGTTTGGGAYTNGTVFRVTPAGALATLWSFTGGADGSTPVAGLLPAADGVLYGSTSRGGSYGAGTVFGITTNGVLLSLVQFDGFNGANPQATLIQAADGLLYGTSRDGGAEGKGTAFALGVTAFPRITRQPVGQDAFTGADVTFSVAAFGGAPLSYQWRKDGTNLLDAGNLSGVTTPTLTLSNVTLADAGSYSVLVTNSLGSVLSSNAALAVMASPPIFTLQPAGRTVAPGASVTLTARVVGSLPLSFQWRKNGTNLADTATISGSTTTDLTLSALVEPDSGTYSLFASNSLAGGSSDGAIVAVTPPSAAGTRFATLHWFTDGEDGGSPNGLMQATNVTLYGTTAFGGTHRGGTLFGLSPDGALSTVLAFGWTNGALPAAPLVQANDGALYGTTEYGGDFGAGTVFRLPLKAGLATLHSFSGLLDGANPFSALVQGSDGNLYGTTQHGSVHDEGAIFRITLDGAVTTLYAFSGDTNGSSPVAALVQAPDGFFYGTMPNGGSNYCGNVFRMAPDGRLTNLYSFRADSGSFPPAGKNPVAALVRGFDGAFYGTTKHSSLFGSPLQGTIFKITTNGLFTALYAFNAFNPGDGWFPEASLVQGSDGNFYGTASSGGVNGLGTVFRVTPAGAMTTLVSFDGFDTGAHPLSALVAAADGSFYGTTTDAGLGGYGTVFRLSFAPQIVAQPANQTVLVGANVAFTVSLFGSQPFAYQWRRNGTNLADGLGISGAASSVLTLAGVSTADSGTYSVVVTNALGSVTSTGAVLTVLSPPVFQAIRQTNASVILTWSTVSGRTYQLQYMPDLASMNWSNLGVPTVAAGAAMTASEPTAPNSRRFYRVLLIP